MKKQRDGSRQIASLLLLKRIYAINRLPEPSSDGRFACSDGYAGRGLGKYPQRAPLRAIEGRYPPLEQQDNRRKSL